MAFALAAGLSACAAPMSPDEFDKQAAIHAQFTVQRAYTQVRRSFEAFIRSCVARRSANYQPMPLRFLDLDGQRTTRIWLVNDALPHNPAQLITIRAAGETATEITSKTQYPPAILERDLRKIADAPGSRGC